MAQCATIVFKLSSNLIFFTGLYAENHNIIGNYFYDAQRKETFELFNRTSTSRQQWYNRYKAPYFYLKIRLTNKEISLARWQDTEPIWWVTNSFKFYQFSCWGSHQIIYTIRKWQYFKDYRNPERSQSWNFSLGKVKKLF